MRTLPFMVLLLLISATAPLFVSGQETAVQPDQSSYSITTQTSDAYVSDDPSPEDGGGSEDARSKIKDELKELAELIAACFVVIPIFILLMYVFNTFKALSNMIPAIKRISEKQMLKQVLGLPFSRMQDLTRSDRGVSTPTKTFAGRIKEGKEHFRVGVIKEGSYHDIKHIQDALANQYGYEYSQRNPSLSSWATSDYIFTRSPKMQTGKMLVYRDPQKYKARLPRNVTDSSAPGSATVMSGSVGDPTHLFLFGRVDGKILYNVIEGNIEQVGKICEELIESVINFSKSGAAGKDKGSFPEVYDDGTRLPPIPTRQNILPTRLSWLEVGDTDSRHAEWLEHKGRKPTGVHDIIQNEEYKKLSSKYKKFVENDLKQVNRIQAHTMHGDCRVSNWIWHQERNQTVYSAIDFGNYNARFSKDKQLTQGINRRSSVGPQGEEIEWIRPYLFGHWNSENDPEGEEIDKSPDAHPDPLFDLAELLASMLLDIWVDPDPLIEKHMIERMDPPIERIQGENLLCEYWENPQSNPPPQPLLFSTSAAPHCYSQIIKTSMDRIEDWLDSLDINSVPHIKRDKDMTKQWFRYAIADRLIYKACLISNHEERYEIGEGQGTRTTDIAVKMALYFVNNEYTNLDPSAPAGPPPPDEDEDDEQGPEPTETGSPNTVNWPGDIHGDPTITITQINKSTVVTGYPDSSAEGSSSGGQNANPSEPSSPNELAEHTETHFLANTDNTGGFAVGDQVYVVDTDGEYLRVNDTVWFGEILFIRDNEGILEAVLSVLEQPGEERRFPVDRLRRRNDYLD